MKKSMAFLRKDKMILLRGLKFSSCMKRRRFLYTHEIVGPKYIYIYIILIIYIMFTHTWNSGTPTHIYKGV